MTASSAPEPAALGPEASFQLNGRPHAWREGLTVAGLLAELEAQGPGVAVERNERVIRRADHPETMIDPGDRIEVVRLVGGG